MPPPDDRFPNPLIRDEDATPPAAREETAREREIEDRLNERLAGLPATPLPIPVPAPKAPTPVPFPSGPAANDPVFSQAGTIARVGNIAILGASVAALILRKTQEDLIEKELIEADIFAEFELETRKRKEERDAQLATIGAPVLLEAPGTIDINFPEAPASRAPASSSGPEIDFGSISLPEIPIVTPTIPETLPGPSLPVPLPTPPTPESPAPISPKIPLPNPGPAAFPAPGPLPGAIPSVFPGPGPAQLPFFVSFPEFSPIADSPPPVIGDPELLTPLGTPVQSFVAGTANVPSAQPSAQAQQSQCREVKRRRRRKGKCREGFYREFPGKTQFTPWREVNCATREETDLSKRKREAQRLAGDLKDNVVSIFTGK